jgi:CBS domain containing-hemolysin-like protein
MTLILFYLFLALSVSFLCSVMEAVLLSTPLSYITLKEKEGGKAATLLKHQKQHIDDPIAAILSLNTIAHTIGAAGVGAEAVRVFGEAYFGLISAILVLSEIIPKSVGANYWRTLALPSARIIQGMVWITYPLVLLSKSLTHLISSKRPIQSVSREEVSAMVTVGLEEGVFEKKENRMIQSLIKLDKQSVHNIMTPSTVVAAASVNLSLREFYANEAYSTYSRIPVYDENRDFLIGYGVGKTVGRQIRH